jgi:alkylation response protein AidB-like acyl-CoA dehydrogenase
VTATPTPGEPEPPLPDDPEESDPGLARERTSLAWTRTAISFAALGGAVLKVSVASGLIILAMAAIVWRLGWTQRPGAQRLGLITVSVVAVALLSLVITLTGPDAALRLPHAGPLGYALMVTTTSQLLDLTGLPGITKALAAGAEANDRDASFPAAGIAAVQEAGLLTATIAQRYGGPGAGLADTVAILAALGKGDPSVAMISAMTVFAHAMQRYQPDWPDDAYADVVAESVTRPVLINALRVEPDLGTPARGGLPATIARRTREGWAITGRKTFSTGAGGLTWMLVWSRTEDDQPQVGAFLVRGDAPGIAIERTWDHLGLRASRSDDVIFDGAPAHGHTGLEVPRVGFSGIPGFAAWNCLGLAAIYLGVASAARDWLIKFLNERTPASLGAPLATLPRFQAAVGEIDALLGAADDLIGALARRFDDGDETVIARAPAAKLIANRAAIDSVAQALALVGNNGLTRKNPLERHYRDVLCSRVHSPQDDTIVASLGKAALREAH